MSVYKPIAALMAVACAAACSASARADDDAAALRAELQSLKSDYDARVAALESRIDATGSRVGCGRTATRSGGGHDCTCRGQQRFGLQSRDLARARRQLRRHLA